MPTSYSQKDIRHIYIMRIAHACAHLQKKKNKHRFSAGNTQWKRQHLLKLVKSNTQWKNPKNKWKHKSLLEFWVCSRVAAHSHNINMHTPIVSQYILDRFPIAITLDWISHVNSTELQHSVEQSAQHSNSFANRSIKSETHRHTHL